MSTNSISDWIVSLGVEVDSKAEARIKKLEDRISKIATVANKADKQVVASANKKDVKLNKELSLREKQITVLKSIETLQTKGASKEQADALRRQANSTKDVAQIQKVRVAVAELLLEQRKLNRERAKTPKVAPTPKQTVSGEAPRMSPLERRGIDQLGFRGEGVNKGINIDGKMDVDIARAKGLNTTEGNTAAKELGRIKKEMADVIAMSKKTGVNIDALNKKFGRLAGEAKGVTQALNKQSNATHNANFATKSLVKSATHLLATYASVFALIQGGRAFFDLGKDIESTRAVMLAATGDTKSAEQAFGFVSEQAIRLGQSVKVSAKSFAKFGAAARGSGLSLEETKEIFKGISEVNLAFQLDAQSSGLAFLAFEQMLSKGTVSMEELRRQLGERWPGAFKQAANSMGITTQEMNKLVSSGQLMSKDFVGKFVKQMSNFVKESGAFEKALEKVATAQGTMVSKFELAAGVSFERSTSGFNSFFTNIGFAIEELSPLINVFGKVFSELGRTIGYVSLLLSPVLGLLVSSFDNVFMAMERATDTGLDINQLTVVEAIFRGIAIAVNTVNIALLYLALGFSKLSEMLGGDKDNGSVGQIIAIGVALLTLLPAVRLIRVAFKPLMRLFGKMGKLFGWVAGKLGLVSKASKGLPKAGSVFKGSELGAKVGDGFQKAKDFAGKHKEIIGGVGAGLATGQAYDTFVRKPNTTSVTNSGNTSIIQNNTTAEAAKAGTEALQPIIDNAYDNSRSYIDGVN